MTFTHDFVSRRVTHDYLARRAHDEDTPRGTRALDAAQRNTNNALQNARGAPSNPVVYRIREDMSWEDVLHNSPQPVRHFLNGLSIFSIIIFIFVNFIVTYKKQ